jgi:hypothetical protein
MAKRLAWGLLLVALAASTAGAQAKPDYEAAKRHYMAGKDASARGDNDAAVKEFILAYDITKDPSLFRQIGVAYEAQGKRAEAAIYYRRFLNEAKPGAEVDDVRARLTAIEGRKPSEPPPPKPAGAPPAKAEPLPPEPPKLPPPESEPAVPERAPIQPPLPSFSETEDHWQRATAWVFVGLAAIGVTTGAVLATSAQGREEDIRRLIDFRDPTSGQPSIFTGSTKDDYNNKVSEGDNLTKWATISFIGAGVCAGAATVFFILDATRGVPKEKVTIAPYAGPGSAGIVAGWGF